MVVLILFSETDNKTGKKTGRLLVSHGVDTETGENVPLPPETPEKMGWYNNEMKEWILK